MDDETNSEKTRKNDGPTTLLEDLRAKRLAVNALTLEEERSKMMVIQEHCNEFPAKLRPAIHRASRHYALEPRTFLAAVYEELRGLLHGRSVEHPNAFELMMSTRGNDNRTLFSKNWHGLDRETDTEDQVEVAIRCFPQVLKETVAVWWPSMGTNNHAVYLALTSKRAVSFVPLMIQLTCELHGELGDSSPRKTVKLFKQLLLNRYPLWVFGQESSQELDKESLKTLVYLKDTGTIATEDLQGYALDLIQYLFFQPVMKPAKPPLPESSLIESRLRLLLDWHPLLPIEEILCRFLIVNNKYPIQESVGRTILSTILDYGLTRAPLELGFLFHSPNRFLSHKSYFSSACDSFGTAMVLELFRDKLVRALEEESTTRTLRAWVAEVAANDEIGLDGLYTLIRLDPITALLPESKQPLPPMVE